MRTSLAVVSLFLASAAVTFAQIRVERVIQVNQPVPDNGFLTSTLVFSNAGLVTISDVNVALSLSSPFPTTNPMRLGNMYATLTHGVASEAERLAVLLNRPGVTDTTTRGSALSSLNVTFDDSGAASNIFGATSATGVYKADGRLGIDPYAAPVAYNAAHIGNGLDALNGDWLASNTWTLLVADARQGAVGQLDHWRLTLTGLGASSGTLDPGAGGTITDTGGTDNTIGAVINVGDGTGANAVTTTVSNTMSFQGGIAGSGDMLKAGSGTLVLAAPATNFTGVVRVNEGKLEIAASNAVGSGRVALEGTNVQMRVGTGVQFSAPIEVSTNGAQLLGSGILAGAISGNGRITKTDAASTLVLAGNNSFTGGTVISNGALRLANSGAAGLGSVIVAQGARLELSNAIRITNTIDATGQISFVSTGNVLAGVITNNNTVYNVNAGTTNEVSAYITGEGGLELVGGGVLEVTGTTNDYEGATTISNGTLRVNTLADAGTASSIGVDNSIVLAGSTAANAILQYTNTADVAMNRDITLTNNGGGTIDVTPSASTVTLTGSMANASGTTNTFVKAGAGEIVLSNGSTANNFAATSIQVNAGALTLGAANQIANGTDLILNGGTFRTGNASAGYAESLGDLTLNASSTIDLGAASGLRDLVFVDSSGVAWSGGATLTVANWAGTLSGGTAGRIFFGSSASGLGSGQLSQIAFSGYSAGAQLLGTGELVPLNLTAAVPEPGTYAAAAILLALAVWHHRRRMRSQAAST
jgi:autotransporter-associated beta strand protein